jgi:hypothetical protein
MTLFDAPRILISLCINMSNMVLEQVVHRMYILLCFLLLVTGFYPVWFGHCGFLEMKKLACGDRAKGIGGMYHNGAL